MSARQGELWWASLAPTLGREVRKTRPILVVSRDRLPESTRLVLGVPATTTPTGSPLHVALAHGEAAGIERVSYLMPEHVRSLSTERLVRRIARVPAPVCDAVRDRLHLLLRRD